ncbi:MAG: substrate-binding domain-containing protein, partial [Deinococcota bacterium]
NVAKATRARVREVITALGYRPNSAARQLVTGARNTVGIISYGMNHYGPAQMVQSIERALKQQGYGLVLASLDSLEAASLQAAITALEHYPIAGLILVTPLLADSLTDVAQFCGGVPFVLVDAPASLASTGTPTVRIDQALGSRLATEHILSLGHRRIAEISGPRLWSGASERHQAWSDALCAVGLSGQPSFESDWTAAGGFEATENIIMTDILELAEPVTAIVAGNDQMALGAIAALHARGLRVPDDVSVVGFDNVPEARFYEPPLTTISQQFDELGEQSSALLLELMTAKPVAKQAVLAPKLVVRSSTAPPRRP